jgi:hypothetical protein
MLANHEVISADTDTFDDLTYLGCVDDFDIGFGICGWVVDSASLGGPVAVELLVGGVVILDCAITRYARNDLTMFLPEHSQSAGFMINLPNWERFRTLLAVRPEADFHIRIVGTNFLLPRGPSRPNLQAILERCGRERAAADQGFDLFTHLSQLASPGGGTLKAQLQPDDATRKGLIEAICLDDQDSKLCWLIGWTTDKTLRDERAVLVDGQRLPAAFSIITYPRADVPGGGGFVGVMVSDWRPRPDSEPVIWFGPEGRAHLRSVHGLRRISKTAFIEHFNLVRESAPAGRWADFVTLMHGAHSWFPAADHRGDVRASIDRFFILPGFGCFVSGWVLSDVLEVQGFAVKLGDTALPMQKSSLYFRPRPDLLQGFPDRASLMDRAGFCCFFPGAIDLGAVEKPLLKVFLEPKGSTVHPVDPQKLRRLGHSESIDALLILYPSIESEPFFPDLVAFIRQEHRRRAGELSVVQAAPASRLMVFALSDDRPDFVLALEEIRYNAARYLPADCGIAIIVGANQPHGEVMALFKCLDPATQRRCSLFLVRDTDAAMLALQDVLMLAGAEDFVFIPARHYLSAGGWDAAAMLMRLGVDGLTIFGTYNPETMDENQTAAGCFAWSWAGYSKWLMSWPASINALPRRAEFPAAETAGIVDYAAYFSKSVRASRMDLLVNQAIHA